MGREITPFSVSLHNGTRWSRQHNIRGANLDKKEEHIEEGGYHVSFIDTPIEQSYLDTFGQSVLEYNAKQKRNERKIVDYLSKVREDNKRDSKRNPHASYEMILTIGNRDNRPGRRKSEAIMYEWLQRFQQNNPNVVVFGAYFHDDEPDSAPHMHVDYYFVKRENKRGLSVQVSQNGALKEMGYNPIKANGKMIYPQEQFQDDSRELLRQIAREKYLIVEDKHNGREKRQHLDTKLFKKKTELEKVSSELDKATKEFDSIRSREKSAKLRVKREEERVRKAEERLAEIEKKEATLKMTQFINSQLRGENERLRSENNKLMSAVIALNKALDTVESFLKKYTIGEGENKVSMWAKAKDKLFNFLGKNDYNWFNKVRHEDEFRGIPQSPFKEPKQPRPNTIKSVDFREVPEGSFLKDLDR